MTPQIQPYDSEFFENIHAGASESAKQIVPLVNKLLSPRSVLDVGCGGGEWLSVFSHECKTSDFLGVDGDYVDQSALAIPPAHFRPHDLKLALDLQRRFDLVVSLEVAEHIPFENADTFVGNLTRHGDAVLFSAAIPGQGGNYHVNEQFPEFWAAVFRGKGYSPIDILREDIWHNERVAYWYRQNILLFVNDEFLKRRPDLQAAASAGAQKPLLTRIHPTKLVQFGYYRRLFPDFNLFGFTFALAVKECRRVMKRLMEKCGLSSQAK